MDPVTENVKQMEHGVDPRLFVKVKRINLYRLMFKHHLGENLLFLPQAKDVQSRRCI